MENAVRHAGMAVDSCDSRMAGDPPGGRAGSDLASAVLQFAGRPQICWSRYPLRDMSCPGRPPRACGTVSAKITAFSPAWFPFCESG